MVHLVLSIFSTFSFPLLVNTPMMGLVDPYVAYGSAHTLMPTLARWLGPLRNLELVAIHHHQNRQPLKEKKKGKKTNTNKSKPSKLNPSAGIDGRHGFFFTIETANDFHPRLASPPPLPLAFPSPSLLLLLRVSAGGAPASSPPPPRRATSPLLAPRGRSRTGAGDTARIASPPLVAVSTITLGARPPRARGNGDRIGVGSDWRYPFFYLLGICVIS